MFQQPRILQAPAAQVGTAYSSHGAHKELGRDASLQTRQRMRQQDRPLLQRRRDGTHRRRGAIARQARVSGHGRLQRGARDLRSASPAGWTSAAGRRPRQNASDSPRSPCLAALPRQNASEMSGSPVLPNGDARALVKSLCPVFASCRGWESGRWHQLRDVSGP